MNLPIVVRFLKRKVIYLNIIAEFFASVLFSLLYFVFISRHLSPEFDLDRVVLSYAVGLSFFAAIFIPFYTYRINIIPFISVANAVRKKQWVILLYKIPAQFFGALLGVYIFILINDATTQVNVHDIRTFFLSDPFLVAFINGSVAGLLFYGFFVIRILFKFKTLTGTIILGLLVAALFFFFHFFHGISALNPFGLLFYDLLTGDIRMGFPWYYWILIHIIFPVFFSVVIYYYLKGRFGKPKAENGEIHKEQDAMANYDI